MTPTPSNPASAYLRNKVLTASPRELRLMLYDGALKFCHQAIQAIETGQIEPGFEALMRAQKIVLELSTSLKHDVEPDLCAKLSALYTYLYRLLVDANMTRDAAKVEEALRLLEYERQTWVMLMEQLGEPVAFPPDKDLTGAQQTAMSSLSLRG